MTISLPRLLLGLSLAAILARAQAPAPSAPAASGEPANELALTMSEAIVRALDSNIEVTIERLKPQVAEQKRRFALGAFDPHLDFTGVSESLERPQNTRDFFATGRAVEVMTEDNLRFEGSLGGLLPTGTRYNVAIKSYSLKNTLNREALARFYPEYTSSFSFTVTQPLLRGFGTKANLAEADIARLELKTAEQGVRSRVDQIAANVLDSYIEAQYAGELVHVITERINVAERLRAENEKRLKQGQMAPIDVMQAESTKASAEIELIRARSFQTEAENRLRELLFPDFVAATETRFLLTDPLGEVTLAESLPALRNLALERSPDYQMAQQRVDAEKLRVRYARNQLLPRVDLQASVGLNGLGPDYGGSFSDFSQRGQPDITIGVIASVPVTFMQERARLRQSLLELRAAEFEVKRTANRIVTQVHTAYTRVQSARQRAESATHAVTAAEAALDAES
ncbi:MAG: outer rane channel protein, partial [Verrucomicrobia bacterium]|nr:outer rane channel protein [Verrucomicrobiota bacterium]